MFIFRITLAVFSAYVVLGSPLVRERRNANNTQPIVNGQDSVKDDYPWQIMLKYDGSFYCGGSIINKRTVLTAAHCVEDDPKQRSGQFSIVAGEWQLSSNEGTEQEIEVAKVKMHKGYDDFELFNDIAILQLKEDLVFDASVQPVGGLAGKKFDKDATRLDNCAVSGWGRFSDRNNRIPDILQELTPTDVVTNRQCNKALQGTGLTVTSKMVCTVDDNAGICNGDSGGPMGCYDDNGDFIQVGVVSWGPSRMCANGRQVFTRVSKYIRWINKQKVKV